MHICAPSRKTANLTVFKTAFKTIEFSQTLEFSEKKKSLSDCDQIQGGILALWGFEKNRIEYRFIVIVQTNNEIHCIRDEVVLISAA